MPLKLTTRSWVFLLLNILLITFSSIWENVFVEVREDSTHAQLQESSASEDETSDQVSPVSDYSSLIFGRLVVTNPLASSHPSPVHIFRLWQTFIDNIHPLTHLLHAPTTQSLILQASGDLDKIPANLEALMFAIYHIAIASLDEQECQSMFGESRTILQAKYSNATQQALCNAKVLKTSDVMVLQALSLYLVCHSSSALDPRLTSSAFYPQCRKCRHNLVPCRHRVPNR